MVSVEQVRAQLRTVLDPELPVVDIVELGLVREIEVRAGRVRVSLTPTYSGCPAWPVIQADVAEALEQFGEVELVTVHAPPWTTDWVSESAHQKLRAAGIAPPNCRAGGPEAPVACPLCDSHDTVRQSEFGATACKSLWRCRSCAEPFELLKVL